ncbi:uncharacterized protein MELLADRAFT_103061 [Melampsora larici-populina 98AG31]|uniref:Uncharacterized protein n=1 Tax=Melampsora larici-populina (strain 98AG31 / pathotype 3-4-7) TaxID=747676 RepID=F4RAE9_MELLP|nr:uncharacterized protein MELLADRAFT_103061 [Melampsora larici-populina 98AG31]EGG10468.1 hypothetical protein MELLADRAFT_103061 [Melampsora larici-populina 98AG31]
MEILTIHLKDNFIQRYIEDPTQEHFQIIKFGNDIRIFFISSEPLDSTVEVKIEFQIDHWIFAKSKLKISIALRLNEQLISINKSFAGIKNDMFKVLKWMTNSMKEKCDEVTQTFLMDWKSVLRIEKEEVITLDHFLWAWLNVNTRCLWFESRTQES